LRIGFALLQLVFKFETSSNLNLHHQSHFMEEIYQESPVAEVPQTFEFKGKGSELFGIQLPNWVLTVITAGIYYPWAKAEKLKYLYQKTEFAGSRFKFHGTGKEMFKGFVKAVLAFAVIYGIFLFFLLSGSEVLAMVGLLFFYFALAVLIPVAIYGSLRYRLSRTSWRGIHFSFTASLKEIYLTCIKGIFLTFITFGIYGAWFMVDLRKKIISNIRIGNIRFEFEGEGGELFMIHLKGYFLSMFTLGIYLFWYMAELHRFYFNNIVIVQNGNTSILNANVNGAGSFKLIARTLLIVIFPFGLGTPLATVRTMRYVINNCELYCNLDLENLEQADPDNIDATLEDVSDILNLDLV